MKKFAFLTTVTFLLINTAFAGGILTNTNQSAQFVRMLSRNASTDLDAVYFNPAGLTQLNNGFYFGLHNQSIFQNRTINSGFPLLNDSIYKGKVLAPVFPTAFAVYKLNNWAFSLGFGPNGGGGSAKYDTGLPSFEKLISSLPMSLSASGIPTTEYSANIKFEGSSVFWGTQLNGTYAINDIISVSAGVRVIIANNTYNGYIKDIMVNPNQPTYDFDGNMRTAPSVFTTLSVASVKVASDIQPYVTAASTATLAQLVAGNKMTQATADALAGGLGISPTSDKTISQIQSDYNGKAIYLSGKSVETADKEVDTKQTGTGFTPIIGIDIHLDKLNVGLKYEHQTTLTLTNSTKIDGTGLFPDGDQSGSDIPAIISGGADYEVTDKLKASASFNMYLDKNVDWHKNVYMQDRTIDNNYLELAFGLEYQLTDNFALSAGYLNSNTGVSEQYQSDFSFSNDSYTAGLGFQWNINDRLVLDAGAMLTTYKDDSKTFTGDFDELAKTFGSYSETYGKDTFAFAFGVGYTIMEYKSKGRRR